MADNGADKWNSRYQRLSTEAAPQAAAVLQDNRHLLPAAGTAVDIACGRGGNALLLAATGLDTWAWDYAESALSTLAKLAQARQLNIRRDCRDVVKSPPPPASFDVIVVSHFLDRSLMPHLVAALRPDGLIFYQTFIHEAVNRTGPDNPEYRLAPNELLHFFNNLQLVYYREEGLLGDQKSGFRDRAQYIGCQRSRS